MDEQQDNQPMMLADESDVSSVEFKLTTAFGYFIAGLVLLCILAFVAMVIGLAIIINGDSW